MTDTAVLVLNRHFQPIHVTNAKRALSLLYLGVARVIDREFKTFDFDSWAQLSEELASGDVIKTVGGAIRVPRVIVLQLYDRIPKTKVRFSRHNIYMRDGNTCQYCGQELPRSELNLDHVVPRAQGGRTTWENVVCCCIDCNLTKAARTPDQATRWRSPATWVGEKRSTARWRTLPRPTPTRTSETSTRSKRRWPAVDWRPQRGFRD